MGSYTSLSVAGHYLGGTKNAIDPGVMMLFRTSDRIETVLVPGTPEYEEHFTTPEESEHRDNETRVVYEVRVDHARDRLDLLGFTPSACRQAFDIAVARKLEELRASLAGWQSASQHDFSPRICESIAEEIEVMRTLTPERWLQCAKQIMESDLTRIKHETDEFRGLQPLIRLLLSSDHTEWLGCPARDVRVVISLFLEIVESDDVLSYDLTDLVASGWLDTASDLIEHAEAALLAESSGGDRVVVITEGSSDRWVIERSLAILRPHVADYFVFMDFEAAKVSGGAGALATTVKAFVGAGIRNRIVAVFDNDTAANDALRSLAGVRLPANFSVMQYPDLDSLRDYPTLGPTGVVRTNVNGLAASIELYLGVDVLRGPDGELSPVHWRGYNEAVRAYQGEVLGKTEIHRRFREKLKSCEEDRSRIAGYEWGGLNAILDALASVASATAAHEAPAFERLDL